jgi:hypothetical protein
LALLCLFFVVLYISLIIMPLFCLFTLPLLMGG